MTAPTMAGVASASTIRPDAPPAPPRPLRSYLPTDRQLDELADLAAAGPHAPGDALEALEALLRWAAELSTRLDQLPLAELAAIGAGGGMLGRLLGLGRGGG